MDWLIAHLVGDYLLQTDWMAKYEKESSWACTAHVLAYMLSFLPLGLAGWQLLLIAGQQRIQDKTQIVLWYMTNVSGQKNFATDKFFLP